MSAIAPLTRSYDSLFARHAGVIPVAYLRSLAKRESNFNSGLIMPGGEGAARGLMQVVGVLRNDYNRVNGTSYTPADLLDPETNVKIASWLLNRIVKAYAKHPSKNLQADWSNPEFVKLLTMGWNAGYSEGGGVGRVATYLERSGLPVTHDSVHHAAESAGAARWLSMPARVQWHRSVADLYELQPDRDGRSGPGLFVATMAIGLAIMFMYIRRRQS